MAAAPPVGQDSPVVAGGVTLDVEGRLAVSPDGLMRLTRTQAELLAHLMRHPGHVCSREELMSEVWGYPVALGSRTVDVHVAALRDKLRKAQLAGLLRIRTVRGTGYSLDVDGQWT